MLFRLAGQGDPAHHGRLPKAVRWKEPRLICPVAPPREVALHVPRPRDVPPNLLVGDAHCLLGGARWRQRADFATRRRDVPASGPDLEIRVRVWPSCGPLPGAVGEERRYARSVALRSSRDIAALQPERGDGRDHRALRAMRRPVERRQLLPAAQDHSLAGQRRPGHSGLRRSAIQLRELQRRVEVVGTLPHEDGQRGARSGGTQHPGPELRGVWCPQRRGGAQAAVGIVAGGGDEELQRRGGGPRRGPLAPERRERSLRRYRGPLRRAESQRRGHVRQRRAFSARPRGT